VIKIKIIAPGQNDQFIMDRVTRNFIYEENRDENFTLTTSDDFDYLIVCNRARTGNFPKERIIGMIMEPSWSPNWDRCLDAYAGTIFVHDNSLFHFKDCEVIERPSLMFTEFYNSSETADYLLSTNFEKTKKVNIIVSGMNHHYALYQERQAFIKNVIDSNLPIEIFGRYWAPDGKWLKGPFEKKLEVLKDYEFSIGIENSCEKNYISEKFFDPFMTNTVPVYYGCPNVTKVYDKDSFIELDIFNPNNYIPLLEDLLYKRSNKDYLNKVIAMKKRYLRENNLYTEIIKLIKSKGNI
jgi:hypothetical protein